ncbi:MAG: HD domain-containing protein, partial [Elusimicrobiota bacterium]|nr:HD domain-containing protein [Elusimicrobiota bacterium]
ADAPRVTPAAPAAGPLPRFLQVLVAAGAPVPLVERLYRLLADGHPGNQNAVYHGLGHSRAVADLTARLAEEAVLTPDRAALVVLAASLHDLDPGRAPGMPPTVSATLAFLERDPEARALVAEFGAHFGFTPAQVAALIKATDFSPVPARLAELQRDFERSADDAFPAEAAAWGREWGLRISAADKTAAYLGTTQEALAAVRGLAGEFRAEAAAAGRPGRSDADIVAHTHSFLGGLAMSPQMALLPQELQERFETNWRYFQTLSEPQAAAAALAALDAAPTRGPPASPQTILDAGRARRFIEGMTKGARSDEKTRRGVLQLWLEEQRIPPGSARGKAVLAELFPAALAERESALAGVSPALARYHDSLLKLAREQGTTPLEISRTLEAAGTIGDLAGVDAGTFEHQAWLALRRASLERAVRRYPDNAQGDFMRQLAGAMSAPGGKSVEEVAREGVFAYVDFGGAGVSRAAVGRDPDPRAPEMVFYVTRREEKWRVEGYRRNRGAGTDAESKRRLVRWLVAGGIPAADFE